MRRLPLVLVGLVALSLAGPGLVRLAGSLVPLVLVVGVVVVVVRVVFVVTRRW